MRPKGLIGLGVIVLIFLVILFLLRDKVIENQMESVGSRMVGAKVEIDNLDFNPFGLSISLDRLQVTNPANTWRNMFETGRLSFDMALVPLLSKKVIINDITVSEIRINTKRATDGYIPGLEKEKGPGWVDRARESLTQQVEAVPLVNLARLVQKKVDVDSILQVMNIRSLDRIQNVRMDADSTYQKWDRFLSEFNPRQDLNQIASQVNAIKTTDIKGLDDLVSTANKVNDLQKSINSLKTEIETKENQAVGDFGRFSNSLSQVDNWIQDDLNSISNKLSLGDLSSPQGVAKSILGDMVTTPTIGLLRYVGLAREYMPVAQQFASAGKVEKPPRLQGQDILFPVTNREPKFLIEHILISGRSNEQDTSKAFYASGEVTGITSHPRVYGKPLNIDLQADLPGTRSFRFVGLLDHTRETPQDRIQVKAAGIPLGSINLSRQAYLPQSLEAPQGDISADFDLVGQQLDVGLNFSARPVRFNFAENATDDNDIITRITRGTFGAIDQLRVSAGIQGPVDALKLKMSSNIDNVLAQRLQGMVGESIKVARAEIQQRLNAEVQPKKQEALGWVAEKRNQVTSQLDEYKKLVNDQRAALDQKKKELESRIADEKKKRLKGAGDKLKDIFKKP